ncbi:two-component system sensor histidine kinase NtrB [Paenibacillus konkukensis]|uniref:two-component system sensor histidine kinase NtrB n=1 Tax=Paenibacillus konkukensis TaxID=2020716 RepID=UPI00201DEB99|nr:ATP-binding protein [Paenibacillus konkukensis]
MTFGKSNLDFYQLVKYSLDSYFVLQDHKVIYVNQAGFDLLGLQYPEQIIGELFHRFLHPDYHYSIGNQLESVLRGEASELMEQRMVRADGELIDVEVMLAPYHMEQQRLAQVIVRNITQRKLTERRLHNLEKLSSIGQMAAGIAHEVRNPLTAVKGFVQLLEKELNHSYLPVIVDELDNAIKTLNNLLQVAKPDLNNEPDVSIHLCSELESLIFLFQEKLYKVTVHKLFSDTDREIRGKKNLILKAFFNLLKNAIEAIDGKGEITIEHFFKNDMVHIKISDTGKGIPASKIRLLGTPFFTTKDDGIGMGLTQVFTTIHEHGGHIHVESHEGKGTVFHIQLPA